MNPPPLNLDGADTHGEMLSPNEHDEPLFGDPVWINERLQALRSMGVPLGYILPGQLNG